MQVKKEIFQVKRDKPSQRTPKTREIRKRKYPEVKAPQVDRPGMRSGENLKGSACVF